MSHTGLYAGLYEQIREHAELVDCVLIEIKSSADLNQKSVSEPRVRLGTLLKNLGEEKKLDLAARLIGILLRDEAEATSRELIRAGALLLKGETSREVATFLEKLARALELGQAGAVARMRGSAR
jgi:hypothetical protein